MNTMFLLYTDEARRARQTQEDRVKAIADHWAITDETTAQGKFKGASPLQPSSNTLTVRADGANVAATDGPFAETKEVLGGYYIIDCQDAEEAKYWATRLAHTGCISSVEVRPLATVPARVESAVPALSHA
jgi:hypothetical protein